MSDNNKDEPVTWRSFIAVDAVAGLALATFVAYTKSKLLSETVGFSVIDTAITSALSYWLGYNFPSLAIVVPVAYVGYMTTH